MLSDTPKTLKMMDGEAYEDPEKGDERDKDMVEKGQRTGSFRRELLG